MIGDQKFESIYGDYWRFPATYFHQAYDRFINTMLPEMVRLGMIDQNTELTFPHLYKKYNHPDIYRFFSTQQSVVGFPPAKEVALYKATDNPDVEPFLNTSNDKEIKSGTFDPHHPFISFRIIV